MARTFPHSPSLTLHQAPCEPQARHKKGCLTIWNNTLQEAASHYLVPSALLGHTRTLSIIDAPCEVNMGCNKSRGHVGRKPRSPHSSTRPRQTLALCLGTWVMQATFWRMHCNTCKMPQDCAARTAFWLGAEMMCPCKGPSG